MEKIDSDDVRATIIVTTKWQSVLTIFASISQFNSWAQYVTITHHVSLQYPANQNALQYVTVTEHIRMYTTNHY